MALKKGKEEIIFLLNKAIEKFQVQTGKEIVQNTNRKNYEGLAIALSEISNRLPETAETLGHGVYPADPKAGQLQYPFRKYDITGGQIKDALMGLVANPRPFLVDTCYIYNYDMGRLAFEKNPVDPQLIEDPESSLPTDSYSLLKENQHLKLTLSKLRNQYREKLNRRYRLRQGVMVALLLLFISFSGYSWFTWQQEKAAWIDLKKDFNVLPYKVTQAEKDSLEGYWICYIGSPQARLSDPNRYHKVVTNLLDIKFKNGYFSLNRYGASFNHIGYLQFEAAGLVSVHSRVVNNSDSIESPRHSLFLLEKNKPLLNVISASWSFDVGAKNKIIGIREVYQKIGKGGRLEEVINTVENASCQCKIIRWTKEDKTTETFYLKNISLDSVPNPAIRSLIDEKSILLRDPVEDDVIRKY